MRVAREGWPFVLPFVGLALLLALLSALLWGLLALAFAALLLLFFRDPHPAFEGPETLVLAPAYGRVTRVEEAHDPDVSDRPQHRIVTFLSVFDVHMQRVPATGKVVHSRHARGRRVAAFRADAGTLNESHLTVLETETGDRVAVQQIVGLLARRIVCYLSPGAHAVRGQTLGLIKFGSRVDLLVPGDYDILVEPGMRTRGGETPIARPSQAGDSGG